MRDRARVVSLSLCLIVILLTSAAILRTGGHRVVPGLPVREPAPANLAIVDAPTTEQVQDELSMDVFQLYSFSSDELEQTDSLASKVLTGAAVGEYRQSLQAFAGRHVVVTTGVEQDAVADLTSRQARVLQVISQQQTPAGGQTTTSTETLELTATASGRDWKITDIQWHPATARPAGSPVNPADDPEQRTAETRDQLLAAGDHAAEVLYTMDYTGAAAGLANWRTVATGQLLGALNRDPAGQISRLQAARTTMTATADAGAVAYLKAGTDAAFVLVLLTVHTPTSGPAPPQTPVFLTMLKTSGKWLADAIQEVPA